MELSTKIKEHGVLSLKAGEKEAYPLFKKGFEYMKKVPKKFMEKKFSPEQQKEFS